VRGRLYFEIMSLGSAPPDGELVFGAVHAPTSNPCSSSERLITIPLAELAMSGDWQTRCVSFTPRKPFSTFGLYVSGTSFEVALDALRFGPACQR
jgi:hypothetical protein